MHNLNMSQIQNLQNVFVRYFIIIIFSLKSIVDQYVSLALIFITSFSYNTFQPVCTQICIAKLFLGLGLFLREKGVHNASTQGRK